MKGGVLEFTMTDTPSSAFSEFPLSSIIRDTVAVPEIWAERTFTERAVVRLATVTPDAAVYYTTDGSVPTRESTLYTKPLAIDESTTVRAIAFRSGISSFPVEAVLKKRPSDWTVKVISPYSRQYTGGGDNAIVDGIRGTTNFASGEWQGVQGKPVRSGRRSAAYDRY